MYDEAIAKFLKQGAEMLRAQAAEHNAPVRNNHLAGDITVFPQVRANEISVGNTSYVDYAVYVYYGTMDYATGPVAPKPYKKVAGRKKGIKPNYYLDDALEAIVRSGRLNRLLGEFGDDMSEEIFKGISASLNNITVK